MKVKLAVQIFSSSCATALQFLRENKFAEFKDTYPKKLLLRKLNKLFDFLNIRSIFNKSNASISYSNAKNCIEALNETKLFLIDLEDSNKTKLYCTRRHTFITGLCITINGIISLINQLILGPGLNDVKLKYLLTYKISQDNIEVMFGTIRRRGGWNNNPSVQQFMFVFRAILSHVGIAPSRNSNILTDASNDILSSSEIDGTQFLQILLRITL